MSMPGAKEEWAEAEIDGLAETVTFPTPSSTRGRPADGLASRQKHAEPAATSAAVPSPSRGTRRLTGSPADEQPSPRARRVPGTEERAGQGKSSGSAQSRRAASSEEDGGEQEGVEGEEGEVTSVRHDWHAKVAEIPTGDVGSDGAVDASSQGGSTAGTSSREGRAGVDPASWVDVCGEGDVQLLTQDGVRSLGPPAQFNRSTAAQARGPAHRCWWLARGHPLFGGRFRCCVAEKGCHVSWCPWLEEGDGSAVPNSGDESDKMDGLAGFPVSGELVTSMPSVFFKP